MVKLHLRTKNLFWFDVKEIEVLENKFVFSGKLIFFRKCSFTISVMQSQIQLHAMMSSVESCVHGNISAIDSC
jgi:hypothetical protein